MSRQIVETVEIAAPPERVFRALTTPAELLSWWGDPEVCPSIHWELDLRVGGRWLSRWRFTAGGPEFALGGEILLLEPPRLLAYSWWDERYPGLPPTMVRYDLEPIEGGVRVRMTHTGFDSERKDLSDYAGGWPSVLASLRTWTEPGYRSNTDIAIHVPDLERAEAFYCGVLGFTVVRRSERQLQLDTGALTLWINLESADVSGFIPSFDVRSARLARQQLEVAGYTVLRQAGDGSSFYVQDPFGLVLDVIERSR